MEYRIVSISLRDHKPIKWGNPDNIAKYHNKIMNIESIEDLLKIGKEVDTELIVYSNINGIEIYDTYME